MSQPASRQVIRRPRGERLLFAAVGLVAAVVLAAGLVTAVADRSPYALLYLLTIPPLVDAWRRYRVSAELRPDALVVRNRVRTREVERENVAGFDIGPTGWDPLRESVHVRTHDQQVLELAVTRRMTSLRHSRDDLEHLLAELTAWRSASRTPHSLG